MLELADEYEIHIPAEKFEILLPTALDHLVGTTMSVEGLGLVLILAAWVDPDGKGWNLRLKRVEE